MKSTLKVFAALAAFALPAGAAGLAFAQDEVLAEQAPPNDTGARDQPNEPSAPPVQNWIEPRAEVRPAQDRDGGRGGRDGDGNGRDRDGGRQGPGGRDRGDGGTGWNRPGPDTPVIMPPTQDPGGPRQDQNRGNEGGGRGDGGWNDAQGRTDRDRGRGNQGRDGRGGNRDNRGSNGGGQENATSRDGPQRVAPRGSFADSCSGSYVNQGRLYADCRDTRGNVRGTSIELARCSSSDIGNNNGLLVCHNARGDYENRGGNNGGWNRDRNGGGRDWNDGRTGRRDYGGYRDRRNENSGRRDWNRGRSNDWWRNDRAFRNYSGVRFGFYFAPNYGYYSVPRNYINQRWSIGDFLPSIFWRYRLDDYRTYGLGYPPEGTQWVAVDNTVYLIDRYDGYIIDVVYDAWRW